MQTTKTTILFPGGFKPLTGAHLALAQRYAEDPQVDRVILLIGPKERDGITRQKTIEMFNLLNSNSNIFKAKVFKIVNFYSSFIVL
jgi:nicotinic acid mononucleotide adenylyltransferase